MNLKPVSPPPEAPRGADDAPAWGWYAAADWTRFIAYLEAWGVDTSEFSGLGDGEPISEATCLAVAEALEEHLPALPAEDRAWLQPHVARWRTCGGYEQW